MTKNFKMITSGGALVANLIGPIFLPVIFILDYQPKLFWLGVVIEIFFVSFAIYYIRGNSIEIKNNKLVSSYLHPKEHWSMIPGITRVSIALADIGAVTLGRVKYFEERFQKFQDEELKAVFEAYRNVGFIERIDNYGYIKIPIGVLATPYIPVMFVCSNKPDVPSITILTKPFSKNGFRKLIALLRERGIPVATDPSLGL